MGVFDNKENAEKYSKLLENQDYSNIEEFELNEIKPELLEYRIVYNAWIGINECTEELDCSTFEEIIDTSKNVHIDISDRYILVKSLISKEHAKKVAIEQYQIYTQNQLENPPLNNNEVDF